MKYQTLLRASVSTVIAMAAATPLHAQTANPLDAKESPKPQAASDRSINPASPDPQAQDSTDAGGGDIVVTGLRRSLESAQAIKRTSDGIVDAIVAEDIGKLPDTFASSALARVSGVTVTRGAGESAGVTVRGLPDLSTTYNGREIFTAEGRFVQIQDFPAGTVAALEVYKSGTANLIEGGIGGQVNVRGRKPFDFNGFELSGSLNGVNWEQSGKLSWNGNLLVSDRWDTGIGEMGILVNASYVGIDFTDATREASLAIDSTTAVTAPGAGAGIRYPDYVGRFQTYGHRYRPSANAAYQWKPTPELEIYLDGLYQGYRGNDSNAWMYVPLRGDAAAGFTLTNITTRTDNPLVAQSATVTNGFAPDGYYGSAKGKTDTYQAGGGAIWKKDGLQISGDVAYTNSKYAFDLVNLDYAFARSPVRNYVFDSPGTDGGPTLNFVDFDVTNPANFLSRGFYQQYLSVSGKDIQTRGDVSYDFDGGPLKRIQFGVRYNDRDASRDFGDSYFNGVGVGVPLPGVPVSTGTVRPAFSFNSTFPIYTFAAPSYTDIREGLTDLRAFFGAPAERPAYNPLQNFTANEKAYAAYGQLKYGFDLGSIVVDGVAGLRAIKTKTRTSGFSLDADTNTFQAVTGIRDYTDYLPNVSARVGFTDQLQLRLAYTQTRTRPNFFDLRPSLTIDRPNPNPQSQPTIPTPDGGTTTSYRTANGGNPDLRPLTSNNYDASLEWYFSRSGSLTGAIFERDADGFIFTSLTTQLNAGGDPSFQYLRVSQPVNSGKTRFRGAEVGFTSFLDIDGLPDWAKGFGVQANGTYIDSKGDLSPDFNTLLGGARVPFNGVSKWTYNLVGLYERPFFSTRLAYNYRSKFVSYYSTEAFDTVAVPTADNPNAVASRVRGVYERGRGQLDFSATVTPVSNVTVAFDIVNLLGNPIRRSRQFDDAGDAFIRQVFYLERTYSLGVRFRF